MGSNDDTCPIRNGMRRSRRNIAVSAISPPL
jgi:hypothetical protein